MNTSSELMSSSLSRHHAGDLNGSTERSTEPKSGQEIAPVRPARERLPSIVVLGAGGTATVTRMVTHVAEYMGVNVGMTTAEGREEADAAVFMDVGAEPHGPGALDLEGIESLIAERVREGGTLILNADAPRIRAILDGPRVQSVPRRVVFFSLDPSGATIRAHRDAGGLVYLLRDGWIVEGNGIGERRVVRVTDLPVSLGGAARYQITNALAAVAAARAAGFGLAEIACGLKTFETSTHNPGKGDLYQVCGGYVLLEDARTPAAIEALCDTAGRWPARRITGVISAEGDQSNASIELSGKTAARSFDRLFLKDADLGRREPGQVPELLRRSVLAEMPGYPCTVILDEDEAVSRAILEMVTDEVVVIVSKNPERVRAILDRHEARAVCGFEPQEPRTLLSAA